MTWFIDALLLWIGAAGALVSLGIYGLTQAWYRNPIGRFLVVYMVVVVLIYARSVVALIDGAPIDPSAVNLSINSMAAALMIYQLITFTYVIVTNRRRRRRSP